MECQTIVESGITSVNSLSLSSVETIMQRVRDIYAEARAISAVTRTVVIGVDSGAELTVWPADLLPGVPTMETAESRAGVYYWGPGDTTKPTIPDLGKRNYTMMVNGAHRNLTVHVAPVRKPLLAVADLNDKGHDVHFMADGRAWAEHKTSGAITKFRRVGGRYEFEAEIEMPTKSRQGAP